MKKFARLSFTEYNLILTLRALAALDRELKLDQADAKTSDVRVNIRAERKRVTDLMVRVGKSLSDVQHANQQP